MEKENKNMEKRIKHAYQRDFLQSADWNNFQKNFGRSTFFIQEKSFNFSIIEHNLAMVGNYFYLPYGPAGEFPEEILKTGLKKVFDLAQKRKIGWIRFEPETEAVLEQIKKIFPSFLIKKSPKDVQPAEILIIDLGKNSKELLADMHPKTRYNIRLSQKRGVFVKKIFGNQLAEEKEKGLTEFFRLLKVMARRKQISVHPENYYRKMLESFSGENVALYLAEYQKEIIAANLVVFTKQAGLYLHGASDDRWRNVMAPFLLQWEQILDAQKRGCLQYDFGGVAIKRKKADWEGITRFKTGFSLSTESLLFPGTFDLIIDKKNYLFYQWLRKIKNVVS